MDIQIINPITFPGWDDLILSSPSHSFFHVSAWAKVLSESYGYTPIYFSSIEGNKLNALIPVMEVRSILTGKRGVSLPFTDHCEPIISNGVMVQDLITSITEYGKKAGWRYLEFRGGRDLFPQSSPSYYYLGHTLDLSRGEKHLYSSVGDSTRRNTRKASGGGLKVTISSSLDSVKEFFRLNCITRRKHGLPPQPHHFFGKLHEHIISKNLGLVFLICYQEKIIAGAVFFHFGQKAFYKYGASDYRYQHLRPNNLIMWEAIRMYCQNGYKSLCLGRTEPEHKGLLRFKRGWGTTEQQIHYYRYDLKKDALVNTSSRVNGFHNIIFRNLPTPILNGVGALLYRHVG